MKEYQDSEGFEDVERAAPVGDRPSEVQLVQIGLMMRLYDIGLAILHHLDEEKADEVYDHHEKGGHYNPTIFIPQPRSDNEG